MKQIFALVFVGGMIALTSCGGSTQSDATQTVDSTTVTTTTPEVTTTTTTTTTTTDSTSMMKTDSTMKPETAPAKEEMHKDGAHTTTTHKEEVKK